MATILINYADLGYYQAQRFNTQTAMGVGAFDRQVQFRREDLDPEFCKRNSEILAMKRGAGYWLWKPYIVLESLRHLMTDEDVLFYSDEIITGGVGSVVNCERQGTRPQTTGESE